MSNYHSPPAWSMGSAKKGTDWKGGYQNPGPGSYNAQAYDKTRQPTWRIGTASRSTDLKADVPGPGSYDPKLKNDAPKYHFGHKDHGEKVTSGPGPGAYEIDKSGVLATENKAPSYTMRPKTAVNDDRGRVPGPGAYNQTSRILNETVPNVKIGTASRDDLYHGDKSVPGPGSYNLKGTNSAPKIVFGSAKRDALSETNRAVPGPGSYQLKSTFEHPGAGTTMIPRRPTSAGGNLPGPGAYDPKPYNKTSPANVKIGTASRDGLESRNQVPGPGAYDPSLATKNRAPTHVLGTSQRRPLSATNAVPGPGSYQLVENPGDSMPKYTMVSRRGDYYGGDKSVPGPGAYTPIVSQSKERAPVVGMGTSKRDGLYHGDKSVPGPGSYNLKSQTSAPKFGFGSAKRDGMATDRAAPGPGAYQLKSTFEHPGAGTTLVPRRPQSAGYMANPGPGAYDPKAWDKERAPTVRIGTASRDGLGTNNGAPGPGSYNLSMATKNRSPTHVMGSSQRRPLSATQDIPGPGSYNLKGGTGEAPKYSLTSRRGEFYNVDKSVPGPGTYSASVNQTHERQPAFGMGTGQRASLYPGDKSAPGPGTYNLSGTNSAPKFGFGSASRDGLADKRAVPGPGSYALKGTFEGSGGGTSMVPRRPQTASSMANPGPGSYNPKDWDKQRNPTVRIGTASRDGLEGQQRAPGPGAYDPKLVTKAKAPAYGMGSSQRKPLSETTSTPGPGNYDLKSGSDAPKFSMTSRRDVRTGVDVPGPGAYSPVVTQAKEKAPNVKIGTSNRPGLYQTNQGPGPGYYNLKGALGGPKWGFGSDSRDGKGGKESVPGPGTYNLPSSIADVPKYVFGGSPLKIHLQSNKKW